MQSFDAQATVRLLDHRRLIEALEQVLDEYRRGAIESPPRLALPCGPGREGVLLSMPCQSNDLVTHKLLTVYPANPSRGLPAIQGQVTAFDAADGRGLFALDGPTVTARRTAAVSMIGIARLRAAPPRVAALIGTGTQARAHVEALLDLHPGIEVRVRGSSPGKEAAFCDAVGASGGRVVPHASGPVDGDVVIAATTSRTPVFDAAADPKRLVVGVGAFRLDMVEIGSRTIAGSQVYVDDPVGAPGEAGDIAAAGIPWADVKDLADARAAPPDFTRPVFFKSVGCGAWDLAACRTARAALAG